MRVIAGEFRSRLLESVPGLETRPTPDRLRETLFNILAPEISGSVFLDAYAGSGAVGIEALSRGAAAAVFIENSKEAIGVIEANLKSLGLGGRATILRGCVRKKLAPGIADIVFLDPPYAMDGEYVFALDVLGEQSGRAHVVVAQHSSRKKLAKEYQALAQSRLVRQGENALSLYRRPKTQAN